MQTNSSATAATRLNGESQASVSESESHEEVLKLQALRGSERDVRGMIDALPAAIYTTDAKGRITHFNPACVKFSGRTPELGSDQWCVTWKLFHPDGRPMPHDDCPMAISLKQRRSVRGTEAIAERPDGTRIWFEAYPTPLFDDEGNLTGGINMLVDVTQRKAAEADWRAGEERYRRTLSLMPAAVYSCDASGVITFYNDRAAELWGRAPEPGDTDERFCGSEQMILPDGTPLPHDQCPMAVALREGSSFRNQEVNIRRPDGSLVTVLVNIDPIRDNGGRVIGAINAFHDVTAIKQAEQALCESEERFRMIADNMGQLAWTCDKLGDVTWYNRRWLEYTGLPFEEMKDWDWKKVHHPDHVDRVIASVTRSRESGEIWEDTFPLRGKDGRYRWFLSRAYPIRDDEGNIVRWFGTNTDVTDQRAAQESLREADRRKDEFLAMLAHELRNPLAPIGNAVQILRLNGGDETLRSVCDTMERQVGQLVRMVDDLLDVNRISRGKIELRIGRTELASIVHHAVEAVRPICENNSHDLSVTLPEQTVYLDADPARLAQVLGNLLNNACKFTPNGGRISLTAERQSDQVVIRVSDSGVGIAGDKLPRIFDMFTQLDTSLERSVSGLGIGLTLVKNLVEMHNGTVEAQSGGVGRGSTFVVRLPISIATPEADTAAPIASKPATSHPQRILVVDDNRDSANTLAMLLKLAGHQTRVAFDGQEAVAAAGSFVPQIVLLDIGLPKLNGFEAAAAIRELPQGKDMRLVAMTGWGQDEDRQKSKDAGFDAHLVKPIEYAVLTKLLSELVPQRT